MGEPSPANDALHDAPIAESRALRLVGGAPSAVERSEMQRNRCKAVADPVAAELKWVRIFSGNRNLGDSG